MNSATNHNGGRILFGPDGNLWIVTGENAEPRFSQQRANLRGKILRIKPDGSVPNTNPFGTRVYATGIRNSFGMAFDPETDRLWETENGPGCNDEINLIRRGGNFAWGPHQSCGSRPAPRDTNRDGANRVLPEEWFVSTHRASRARRSATAAVWAPPAHGDLFYGDVNTARSVRVRAERGADRHRRQPRGPCSRSRDGRLLDGGRAAAPHLLQRTERDLPPRDRRSAAPGSWR